MQAKISPFDGLRMPLLCAPMFLISSKELVSEQCKAGVIGAFPSLNARPQQALAEWIDYIESEIAAWNAANPARPAAPYAVNLIAHRSNPRLEHDLAVIEERRVPIVITSLNQPDKIVDRVHRYGGLVLHDVSTVRHAHKALDAGVDGLILVCAGAGGHTGTLNPLAFTDEVRASFDGPLVLSGAISRGSQVLAAQTMGADFAYVGTRFIATTEAAADPRHKQMLLEASAADVICSTAVTGLPANYLRASFAALGLDPDALAAREPGSFSLGLRDDGREAKAWRDVWGAGQGAGGITEILPAAAVVSRMHEEYQAAARRMRGRLAGYR